MQFKRLNQRKKTNNKRGFLLVILLFVIIYLFYNMEHIMELIFKK